MAKSRNHERLQKRISLVRFVNHGIEIGRAPKFEGKGVKRAFLAQDNFCVEFDDGSWKRIESKKDRNYIYHQCIRVTAGSSKATS